MVKTRDAGRKAVEDEWAAREDQKKIKKLRQERLELQKKREQEEAEEERKKLKAQHWLCCPKCGHPMQEEGLADIDVDVCTFCEGIFFDRGELEQLLVFHKGQTQRSFFRQLLKLKSK